MIKKHIFAFLASTFISFTAFAQQEPLTVEPMQEFLTYYQNKDFQGFYNLYSPDLKQKVDQSKSSELAFSLSQGFGDITHYELYDNPRHNYFIYKVYFSSGDIFLFQMELTQKGEVDYFQVFNLPKTKDKSEFLDLDFAQVILQNIDSLVVGSNISVALIEEDNISYLDIYQGKNKMVISNDNDKIYSVLNLTDVFTNTMLSKAIYDKEIPLSGVANSYYDFDFKDNLELNLVALSNQRTSLPMLPDVSVSTENAQSKNGTIFLREDLLNYLQHYVAKDTTASNFYSYLNSAIVANVLERHYQKPYDELLQEFITTPYQMPQTQVELPRRKSKVVRNTDQRPFVHLNKNDAFIPSIGAYSTTKDLGQFVQYQIKGQDPYIKLSQKPTTIVSSSILASMAWKMEHTFYNKDRVYFNTGLSASFVNIIVFDPIAQKGLVLLSNINQDSNQEQLFDVANLLMIKLIYGKNNPKS